MLNINGLTNPFENAITGNKINSNQINEDRIADYNEALSQGYEPPQEVLDAIDELISVTGDLSPEQQALLEGLLDDIAAEIGPVITSDGGGETAAVSVLENTVAVTTVTAVDNYSANGTDNIVYSIAGGAHAALFAINAMTGELTFVAPPDFEAGGTGDYEVIVQANDGAVLIDTQTITVTVEDVNDVAPEITSNGGGGLANVSVDENTTPVTTVTSTDPDTVGNEIYSIIGGADAALFSIEAGTGVLSFLSGPDYEAPGDAGGNNVYDVIVQVSDGVQTDTQAIAVTVDDVPDTGGASADTVIGPLFQMNVNVAGNQSLVHVATLANGNVAATWNNGFADTVVGVFDPSGLSIMQFTIPSGGASVQPDIAAFSNGGFVVSWGTGNFGSIFMQRFDASGVAVDAVPQVLNIGVNGNPDVAVLPGDSFVIVYQDDGGGGDNIRGRVVDANGVAGAEFAVNATSGGQGDPAIALLTDGNLAVTYNDDGLGTGPFNFDTFLTIIDPTGAVVSGPIAINTATAGNQLTTEVIALDNNRFLVSWEDEVSPGVRDIKGQIFDDDGVKLGTEFLLNATAVGHQFGNDIVALSDGGFYVAYNTGPTVGPFSLAGQRYDSNGQAVGNEIVIDSSVQGGNLVEMSLMQDGSLFVSYNATIAGGNGTVETVGKIISLDTDVGTDGDDILISAFGDSTLTGGLGDDTFLLEVGSGTTTVTDFDTGPGSEDVLDVSDFGFVDFPGVLLVSSNISATQVKIQLDANDSVILENAQVADLHQDDFSL